MNRLTVKTITYEEIVLPQVKGYNCYKGDFHVHTSYSDGKLNPAARVIEAWLDGLDIVAITDHYEHHSGVRNMLKTISMKDSTVINYRMAKVSHNEFLNAAMDCRLTKVSEDSRMFRLTNNSSITMTLIKNRPYILEPFKSLQISIGRDKKSGEYQTPTFVIENMWHADFQHPKIELTIDE